MIRLPGHPGRRWLRLILLASLTYASFHLGWVLLAADPDSVQELTAITSMFTGLWALGATVAPFLPAHTPPQDPMDAADQLAATVREQWSEEVVARQLRDPRVIPLSWAATDRPVAAPAETVVGPQAGRVLRMSLDGRLEGDFHRAASQLAAGYRQLPSGRLVVLGEPGAGKTVLALMLTLGLLADRAPRTPVPVLLSVSAWDPVSESLDDWIVGTLATAYYGERPQVPRQLLDRRMLLPVLDGLDEIPEAARRSAVRALNEACGDGRGVVLTCRSAEYQDVIEGGSPPLRRAPVVEVAPVSVPDTVAYLSEVNWPDGVDWEPVYAHLRQHPDGPAATALSTPLALSLARAVYRHCDRDPRELLGFDSRHAAEDHLVDHIIPAAYAPPPGGGLPGQSAGAWQREAQQAERWLTFLATYLHQHRERDLAWWLMSRRLLSHWAGLLVGIGVGVITMLGVAAVQAAMREEWDVEILPVFGAAATVLAMLTWYAAPDRPPGRVSFALRGSLHRLRGGFRTGFALTSVLAVVLLGTAGVISSVTEDWLPAVLADFLGIAAYALGASIAVGVAFAVHEWLGTPPEHSTHATPMVLLRQDRRSSLVGAGLAGAVFGVTALPLLLTVVSIAYLVFLALTGWSGEPRLTDVLSRVADDTGAYGTPELVAATTVLPGAIFAVLMFLPRAWPRFVLLRLFLAARGRLPWRFVRFLSDARERQLLRQSAGTYQFRHIRLQERLAGRSLARNRVPVPRAGTVRRRRLQLAVTGAALVSVGLLVRLVMPEDTSRMTLPTGGVETMVFGPAGKHALVTIDEDGIVRRWDTRTGEGSAATRISPAYEGGTAFHLAAREDGAVIYAPEAEEDGLPFATWRLPWDGTARLTSPGLPDSPVNTGDSDVHALSTGGRYLLTGDTSGLVLRNVRSGEESPFRLDGDLWTWRPALNDRGTLVISEGGRTQEAAVWNMTSGKRLCTIPDPATLLGTDADSTRFVTAHYGAPTAHLWNARCRKEKALTITGHRGIDALALNEDGTELAISAGGATRLYDLPPPGK
ncbi:NACHT domain-containing protein [Streptomyces sp. NPDC050804]|uniref:NACHT and WD40 repeat domain-containing protein n=1 Tax=Streptomyces sp. NPDC050804 TaxID=3154745 RepID=UPI00343EE665